MVIRVPWVEIPSGVSRTNDDGDSRSALERKLASRHNGGAHRADEDDRSCHHGESRKIAGQRKISRPILERCGCKQRITASAAELEGESVR